MRKAMVERDHPQLSIRQQCKLLEVNRNRLEPKRQTAWQPKPEHEEMLTLLPIIHTQDPTMGARQLAVLLKRNDYDPSRWAIGKMMEHLGIKAVYCKPCTTKAAPENLKYPYLLRDRKITKADEVWAIDITCIPWSRGHVYLAAIIDWKIRAVLAWRVSNTMEVDFCLDVLCEAIGVAGTIPEIINTDQGSQFTGVEWLSVVEGLGARVSMDGRGRWMDNVLIERLWRSVKHEWVLLHEYNTIPELEALLSEWIERYNTWRPHTANGGKTPWQAYRGLLPKLEREEMKESARAIVRIPASASILTIAHT